MSGNPRLLRAGSSIILAVFVVALALSFIHGHQRSLPSVALGWPVLLYLERATAATALSLAVLVVSVNLLRGELPTKISTTGIEWPPAIAAVQKARTEAAVDVAESGVAVEEEASPEQRQEAREHYLEALAEYRLRSEIADAITALPDIKKLVITLYYYENMSDKEIGEYLSRPARWVAAERQSALRELQEKLGSDPETLIGDD